MGERWRSWSTACASYTVPRGLRATWVGPVPASKGLHVAYRGLLAWTQGSVSCGYRCASLGVECSVLKGIDNS